MDATTLPERVEPVLEDQALAAALERLRLEDERTLEVQIELTEIPAPPFAEGPRGRRMAELFADAGLDEVTIDEVGNVIGVRPGTGGAPEPGGLVVSAHLDTVFPEGTDVRVREEDGRWTGPGIADDARGLAALVALARALQEEEVSLGRDLYFVATVGEEGAGDLRGAKHLFRADGPFRGAAGFISLDGAGTSRIVTRGLGVRRLRLVVRGPGGHSWIDRRIPNPIHVLGDTVARMNRLTRPGNPPASLTVARWGGGTSINAVPREAWLEIDLRSESSDALEEFEEEVREILARAVARGHNGTGEATAAVDAELEVEVSVIGDRPPGATNPDHPLVQAAVDATRAVRGEPELVASSTDSNVPMALGIPAITMGAGGSAGKAHTPEEWFSNDGGADGLLRALLVIALFAGRDA